MAVNEGRHRGEGQGCAVEWISRGKGKSLVHDRRKGRQCSRDTGLSICLRSSRGLRKGGIEKRSESGCVLQRRERG